MYYLINFVVFILIAVFLHAWIRIGIWVFRVVNLTGGLPYSYKKLRLNNNIIMQLEQKAFKALILFLIYLIILAGGILVIHQIVGLIN